VTSVLSQDLEVIETIWNLNKEWEGLWGDWKGNQFVQLQTESMENSSQTIFKKLNRMSKELKVVAFNFLNIYKSCIVCEKC
jgi:hypothetical protein